MVILNLNNIVDIYLQTDLSISEVDNMDSTLLEEDVFKFTLYPRIYVEDVILEVYDEMSDEFVVKNCYTSFNKRGFQDIYIDFNFENDKTYLIDIKDAVTEDIVWKGRLLATTNEGIQEYDTFEQNSNGIIEI